MTHLVWGEMGETGSQPGRLGDEGACEGGQQWEELGRKGDKLRFESQVLVRHLFGGSVTSAAGCWAAADKCDQSQKQVEEPSDSRHSQSHRKQEVVGAV